MPCRPGGDLLSRVLRQSTIGAEEFNGRVRNGIGFRLSAVTTRPAKDGLRSKVVLFDHVVFRPSPFHSLLTANGMGIEDKSNQVDRAISTGKLNALLRLHTRPINVVVFHGSRGSSRFEVGFPLRCFQRLSLPYIATLLCHWRDNRSTRGTSTPVLSY